MLIRKGDSSLTPCTSPVWISSAVLISVCTRIGFSSLARSIAIASFQSSGLNFSGSGFQEAVSVRHGALLFEAADLEGRGNAREEVQVLADGCAASTPG